MKNLIKSILISLPGLFLMSCEETPTNPIEEVQLKVEVNHVFGSSNIPFLLEKDYYVTSMGDSIQPTTLIYHINNFELSNDNGDKLPFENSYALVDLSDKKSFEVINKSVASNKTFNKLTFTIGVEDSLVNRNGVLNTIFASPMYWGMTNGYIHFKLEGIIKGGSTNAAVLHVGGYVDPYKLAKRITVNLANPISSAEKKTIQLEMDMAQYFKGIDLDLINSIHQPNDDARKISDNWPLMFKAK